MKYEIPMKNWTEALASAIEKADDGDVIVVSNIKQIALGNSAKSRMCPDKKVTFELKD